MWFKKKLEKLEKIENSLTESRKDLELLKKMTESLQLSRKLLFQLADNCPDMLWAKDLDGRYIFINKALCKDFYSCMTEKDILGKTDFELEDILIKNNQGKRFNFAKVSITTDKDVIKANTPKFYLQDGYMFDNYIALLVHKSPLYDEKDELIGTVGVGRKYTSHVLLYKKIKKIIKEAKVDLYSNFSCPSDKNCFDILQQIDEEITNFVKSFYFVETGVIEWKHACWSNVFICEEDNGKY